MTLNALMTRAAAECIDERERYLIMFTQGANGYVCRNEGLTDESQALFHGTYRACQIWIEQRGITAALRQVLQYLPEVGELSDASLTASRLLEQLSKLRD
ncbi:MAG: hypothetical protein JOZ33_01040 [Acidobacteriaceae bacterium]|nr:hypothetical protein [Acidobacteriaceae bacterium]